jgi:hypothetical protein
VRGELLAIRHRKRNTPHREGIGLYTYGQEKNATPYGYFGQIVVGTIVAFLGLARLANQIALRGEEIRKHGSAETDVRGWIGSLAFIVIGLFLGHAGVIFWTRRIVKKVRSAYRKREDRNGH